MFRRAIALGLFSLLISFLGASPTYAASRPDFQDYEKVPVQQLINNGLWSGLNIDFSVIEGRDGMSARGNAPSASPAQTNRRNFPGNYVAMGDSVAAAIGLSNRNVGSCGRTSAGYPYIVATKLQIGLNNLSCSGATTEDLAAQIDQAFANGTPGLITITAGANDVQWVRFLQYCYYYDCATDSSTYIFNSLLSTMQARYSAALAQINERSGGIPPEVIITGYYNPLSADCANLQQSVTSQELDWLNGAFEALNQTISDTAANYSFSRFVSLDFSGHDVCSNDPWVQGLSDPSPFHPTAEGQRQIANAILNSQ